MSLVADELELMVVDALPGETQGENNGYLRELIDRLQARVGPEMAVAPGSGVPSGTHSIGDHGGTQ